MHATPFVWNDRVARPAWQQMAIDRVLADRAAADGTVVLRLYRWQGSSLSFGANEAATRTWHREALERLELPCVRRPTGGRGVWHDAADLTYAVTAPLDQYGDLRTAYRVIHEQLARALNRLDLGATVAPHLRRPTLAPGACFELAIGGEVLVGRRKTIGSAQALVGRSLLQHGAIALADRSAELARFRLDTARENPDIPDAELLESDLVAEAILTTWLAGPAIPATAPLVARTLDESTRYADKFKDPAWTWRR